jgi:hypothetical protein
VIGTFLLFYALALKVSNYQLVETSNHGVAICLNGKLVATGYGGPLVTTDEPCPDGTVPSRAAVIQADRPLFAYSGLFCILVGFCLQLPLAVVAVIKQSSGPPKGHNVGMDKKAGSTVTAVYGFAEEATNFEQRHPKWRDCMSRLAKAVDLALTRVQVMSTPEEKFVHFYGNLVAEDFTEIFLMAANGYGIAAMKLLRSMYEHTVTLRYLHDYPDEVPVFIAYDDIQQYKMLKPVMDTFGKDALPSETIADVELRYAETKKRFMVTDCKTCGTERVNHTWSKLDFVSMAKKTGAIGTLVVPAYYWPLRHAHSTFRAITDRMEKAEGRIGFKRESQPEEADQALALAHNCILLMLEVQNEQFKIEGLEVEIQGCGRDWAEIWAPDAPFLRDDNEATTSTT